ncbi:MAG: HTTM domain-containing protein [Nanoarchaeota archaeon]|nr:HTTM domain-containing protein [Nanoarchaeota archaeon]
MWIIKKNIIYEFFFKKEDYTTIGLLRILTAAVILLSLINDLPFVVDYYSDDGVLSGRTSMFRSEFRFTILDYFGSPTFVIIFYFLLIIFLLLLLIGKYTRFSAIIAFILLSSLHEKNTLILNSGDTLMRLMLFYLAISPSGKCLSLDAIKRNKNIPSKEHKKRQQWYIWPRRLIQIQLAIVYIFAFLPKTGTTWRDGTAVYYFLANPQFARFNLEFLGNYIFLVMLMTYATLLIELLFPILVWFKTTRKYMLIAGILLHSSILFASNITFFSLIMIVAHLAFIEPETINRKLAQLKIKLKTINPFTTKK